MVTTRNLGNKTQNSEREMSPKVPRQCEKKNRLPSHVQVRAEKWRKKNEKSFNPTSSKRKMRQFNHLLSCAWAAVFFTLFQVVCVGAALVVCYSNFGSFDNFASKVARITAVTGGCYWWLWSGRRCCRRSCTTANTFTNGSGLALAQPLDGFQKGRPALIAD